MVSVVVFVVVSKAVIMVVILRVSMCGLCGPHWEPTHTAAALQSCARLFVIMYVAWGDASVVDSDGYAHELIVCNVSIHGAVW